MTESHPPAPAPRAARRRVARTAVVVRTEQLVPAMVRVDLEAIKDLEPPERWPVTRTYTIRSLDRAAGEMAVDFVVHGEDGLAGPWAHTAAPGDALGFFGPGGSYEVDRQADAYLLVGDEAAMPAIAATIEQLPDDIPDAGVPRGGQHSGPAAAGRRPSHRRSVGAPSAPRARPRPGPGGRGARKRIAPGSAPSVRARKRRYGAGLRRYLFVEQHIERQRVSISGY